LNFFLIITTTIDDKQADADDEQGAEPANIEPTQEADVLGQEIEAN
jgi:hypothetical protein